MLGNPSTPTPAQIKVHQIKTRVAPLLDAGQYELAVDLLEEVLPLDRRDPVLHKMLGFGYANLQRTDKAMLHLRRAAELGLRDSDTLLCLAGVYRDTGDLRGAMRVVDKLLAERPDNGKGLTFKARMLRSAGDAEGALSLLDRAREQGAWSPEQSLMRAEMLGRFKRHAEGVDEAKALLADPRTTPPHRRDALFVLGHLYDAMGEHDLAFEAFSKGNGMLEEVKIIPAEEFVALWSPEACSAIPASGEASDVPIFVVGMPRSGTTLTEQILAAHPRIGTVGESNAWAMIMHDRRPGDFDPKAMKAAAAKYQERTAAGRSGGKFHRVVDKMPENYFYLPVMARAFPNASYIHCVRDARDTCLSCFFQNFGTRLEWTRRIETCAKQYLLYRRIMSHWAEVLDVPIRESRYEALTSDPRPHVEALLDHIRMPFDEACMAHHTQKSNVHTASVDQVRNPIYTTSQQRWKRYEKHLGPMLELLDGM